MDTARNESRAGPPGAGEPARHVQPDTNPTEPHSASTVAHDVSAIRAAAMQAAERGWWVFPTRPGSKEPRYGLSWPQAATGDPARLARATWRPRENYGIAAKPSGLVIIDLDRPKPGYELPPRWRHWQDVTGIVDGRDVLAVLAEQAEAADWPHTFTVTTPSGGAHLYYVATAGRAIGNKPLGPMIDVRGGGDGNGGYVLGPGSILNGRAYEVVDDQDPQPLPGWIADLLDPPAADNWTPRPELPRRGDKVAARLDGLIATVLDAKPGERNNTLHWSACRAAEMIAAGQLTTEEVHACLGEAASRTGLDDGEAHRTIASALRQSLLRTVK